jgi:hypothetical protein
LEQWGSEGREDKVVRGKGSELEKEVGKWEIK